MIWYAICMIILLFLIAKLTRKKYKFNVEYNKCESPIEEKLIKKLYELGYQPYSQVKCGYYRIDISLYVRGRKIAIECDGKEYHSSPSQVEHDQKKNYYLKKNKWDVIRLRGTDIHRDLNGCIKIIEKRMKN